MQQGDGGEDGPQAEEGVEHFEAGDANGEVHREQTGPAEGYPAQPPRFGARQFPSTAIPSSRSSAPSRTPGTWA